MAMAPDHYIYCSPLLGVLSLDRILSESAESGIGFDVPDPTPSVDERINTAHAHDALHYEIARLPARQRWVIEAHYFRDRTLTQIARDLGVSVAAVSKLAKKARMRLVHTLAPHRYELLV